MLKVVQLAHPVASRFPQLLGAIPCAVLADRVPPCELAVGRQRYQPFLSIVSCHQYGCYPGTANWIGTAAGNNITCKLPLVTSRGVGGGGLPTRIALAGTIFPFCSATSESPEKHTALL